MCHYQSLVCSLVPVPASAPCLAAGAQLGLLHVYTGFTITYVLNIHNNLRTSKCFVCLNHVVACVFQV